MQKISYITEDMKTKLLSFLYKDEVFNVFLIHFIETNPNTLGELYIEELDDAIIAVLHLKFDGNSYYTSFDFQGKHGLNALVEQLKTIHLPKLLLAGRMKGVKEIISSIGINIKPTPNLYYTFDTSLKPKSTERSVTFRQATDQAEDLKQIVSFLIGFFEVSSKDEIANLTTKKKLLEDVAIGVYFVEYHNEVVGMSRFCGKSHRYADITTVYIEPNYRGRGFGKVMMLYMVDQALSEGKIPVTQTSVLNTVARKTYESLGFVKVDDYLFEFIS